MIILLFLSFLIFIVLGVPIAIATGVATAIALLFSDSAPLSIVVQRTYGLLDSYTLMAIPFFIVSGELMLQGGMSRRLVRFAASIVGPIRGGIAQTVILSSMIFAGVSGSSTADASAIGSILIPSMKERGFKPGWIAALQASAATMGPIIPPSMLMIIYGSLAGTSIGAMFLGGIVPGVLVGVSLMVAVVIFSYIPGYAYLKAEERMSLKEVLTSFKDAVLALIAPIIIVGGIVTGVCSPTEAGVIAAVYAFAVGKFVYKELRFKDLEGIFVKSAVTSAVVLVLAALSSSFGWVLAWEEFPQATGKFLMGLSSNPVVILLIVEFFLLILTCFVEALPALIIFISVLREIGLVYHLDPIHYGVAIVVTLLIGCITPPVGVLLYVSTSIAECKFEDTVRYIGYFIIPLIIILLLITLFPQLVVYIPNLVFK